MDSYRYSDTSAADVAAGGVLTAGVFIFALVLAVVVYVVYSLFLAMIFKKAGVESWKAWVPVYNVWVMLEMGGQPGWISLLLLTAWIPFINFITLTVVTVFTAIAAYRIGLDLGKSGVFVLLYIFLPLVWVIWLAVDSTAVWKGQKPAAVETSNPPTTPSDPNPPAPTQSASM